MENFRIRYCLENLRDENFKYYLALAGFETVLERSMEEIDKADVYGKMSIVKDLNCYVKLVEKAHEDVIRAKNELRRVEGEEANNG